MKFFNTKGFTLIEVLVVISILGILIATATVSYSALTRDARDATRKSDLETLRAALEIYRSNNTSNQYPGFFETNVYGWSMVDNINPDFLPYINRIPQNPRVTSSCPNYLYAVNSTYYGYTIFTNLDNTSSREVTSVKPTPRAGAHSSSDGYRTATITSGTCQTSFNYWLNSP